jgi:hypothetical protein
MAKKIFKGIFGGGKKKAAAAAPASADGPKTRALTADEAMKFDPRKKRGASTAAPRLGGFATLLSDRLGG